MIDATNISLDELKKLLHKNSESDNPTQIKISVEQLLALYAQGWRNFQYANLRYAVLYNANLSNANLRDADLYNANLSYAVLRDANLSYANLRDANLRYAVLYNANLSNANLSNANLYNANLSYAVLRDAVLYNANLRYANLSNANLYNANLYNANLSSAAGIAACGPMRSSGRMIYATPRDGAVWIQAGCWWGAADELRQRVDRVYSGANAAAYHAAIDYLVANLGQQDEN